MKKKYADDMDNLVMHEYILLVDDDMDDCDFFSETFSEMNVRMGLYVVNSGKEMFNFLSKKTVKPKLIFLDLNMPAQNGYECLEELREVPEWKTIPVIIYSTSDMDPRMEKNLVGKAHLYIRKPNSFTKLKIVIQKVLVTDFAQSLFPRPKELFHFFDESY